VKFLMYGRQESSQGICRFFGITRYQQETELAQNTAYRLYDPTYIPGALVPNKICTTYQDKGVQPGDLLAFVPQQTEGRCLHDHSSAKR